LPLPDTASTDNPSRSLTARHCPCVIIQSYFYTRYARHEVKNFLKDGLIRSNILLCFFITTFCFRQKLLSKIPTAASRVEKELQNFRSDAVIHKRAQLLRLLPPVLCNLTFRYLIIIRYAILLPEPMNVRYYKYSVAYSRHNGVDTGSLSERFVCLRKFL